MKTEIVKIDSEHIEEDRIRRAGDIIKEGGLVAFPTETVYGLGGDALDADSSRKIYAAKGRPSDNPLIVHIADFADLEKIVTEVPKEAVQLADAFWPGPSGKPSATLAEHVALDLDGKIPMILDGGEVGIGIESTIVDLTEDVPMILRPGYITPEMIEKVIGEVKVDPGIIASDSAKKPKAPGMKYKHYAPKADLVLVDGESGAVVEKINALAQEMEAQGKKVGIIATDETEKYYKTGEILSIGARDDEDAIARHLYRILREFDDMDVEQIYSESFETPRIGQAIMNRLLKAAGHQVIHV